jgi:uroporphyrinogen decarboxylase
MGDHGLVGVWCGTSILVRNEQEIYDYADDPAPFLERRDKFLAYYEKLFYRLMSLKDRPDFICVGGSGSLIHQTVETFRLLGLPIVQKITRLCKEHNIPSHVHSCGPEKALVKIFAEETDLTVVDPLEIPPMGDCVLKELKALYGKKIVLKGNLHTTNVMLRGTVQEVRDASKKAIDDGAEGGGFILSTGDQCGRDTPDENLFAMIETAKTYGKY